MAFHAFDDFCEEASGGEDFNFFTFLFQRDRIGNHHFEDG